MALHIPTPTTTATSTAPLQVSMEPRPQDVRLLVHVAPHAPLGMIEVQLGYGKGSGGRGRRPLDDARLYADTLRSIASHLRAYAADYEAAALEDAQEGAAPAVQGEQELDETPLPSTLQPCYSCGTLSPWYACPDCEPF